MRTCMYLSVCTHVYETKHTLILSDCSPNPVISPLHPPSLTFTDLQHTFSKCPSPCPLRPLPPHLLPLCAIPSYQGILATSCSNGTGFLPSLYATLPEMRAKVLYCEWHYGWERSLQSLPLPLPLYLTFERSGTIQLELGREAKLCDDLPTL